jgi:hypothetical protein
VAAPFENTKSARHNRTSNSSRSSEKAAASNLPSLSPSGEPPAEGAVGAMAFSTCLWGWGKVPGSAPYLFG